jgi:hypothetical protein
MVRQIILATSDVHQGTLAYHVLKIECNCRGLGRSILVRNGHTDLVGTQRIQLGQTRQAVRGTTFNKRMGHFVEMYK